MRNRVGAADGKLFLSPANSSSGMAMTIVAELCRSMGFLL